MKYKSTKRVLSLLIILSLITVFVGCSKKTEKVETTEAVTTEVATTEAEVSTTEAAVEAEATGITEGGEATVAILNEIDSLDPYLATAAGTKEVFFNVFEGLVKFDEKGAANPAVASDYTLSEDAKTYTFTLREGILFHNGNKVTVDDVIYSLEKAYGKESGTPTAAQLSNIESVVAPDEKTIVITLKEADNDLLPFLTASNAAIIPKDYADQGTKPIGTGPFKFVSYEPQQNVVLEKFGDYWLKGIPHLDKVTFKIFADAQASYLELLAGTIDIYPALDTIHFDELKDDYNITLGYRNMVQLLVLNNKVKPFDDVRVRKALNLAIDTQAIIDTVGNGYGKQIGSGIIPGFTKYYVDGLNEQYKQNIEEAKSLLKEAGYPDGFKFAITAPSNYQFHVDTAQVIVEQLAAVGVTAEIQSVEWGVWLEQTYFGRNYDATVIGITGELSPRDWLGRYVSTADNNFINYSNADYDALYQKATEEIDDAKAVADYQGLQKILSDDAASVFIQDAQFLNVVRKPLNGYKSYPLYVQDLSTIYFEK